MIVGGRYGSLSEEGISYTEKEFDYAKERGLPILAFLHDDLDSIPLGKSEKDPNKRDLLNQFREKVSTGRLIKYWKSPDDLVGKVATSLSQTIMQSPTVGWVRANLQSSVESLQQENELRKQLAELQTYVSKLEKEKVDNESLDNLASLDDEITLRFKHKWWSPSSKRDITNSLDITISWGELFGAISPRLMYSPSEDKARSILGEILGEKKGNISTGIITVNKEDYDTVKIQLMALGLVDVSLHQTTKGGMALFWQLTPKGRALMVKLRAIKH